MHTVTGATAAVDEAIRNLSQRAQVSALWDRSRKLAHSGSDRQVGLNSNGQESPTLSAAARQASSASDK